MPAWAVAAVAFTSTGAPLAFSVKELTVPLPEFDPNQNPLAPEIQQSATPPSLTVPSDVSDPSVLTRYVVTELFDASVATTLPAASKVNPNGRAFTAAVTTGAEPSAPLGPTENTS